MDGMIGNEKKKNKFMIWNIRYNKVFENLIL
jgi:hypothetical protein